MRGALAAKAPHRLDLPPWRAGVVFGALALLFAGLAGRSLWLQAVDEEFLKGQGAARFSRELEVPAHRGRITDRHGEALAISTPVKSLWAFPSKFSATPAQLAELAKLLETTPAALKRQIDGAGDFVYIAKRIPPEVAERALALRIQGLNDENEYRRYYPGGEVMGHVVGFTGDRDAGQEGIELAQQAWLGGSAGSRRVIIDRRGDVVEDVAAVRAPQAGRDLALAIDSRLQFLAFRELKAAVEQHKAKAGGLVVLDVATGEVLALANLPAYNPNRRDKVDRERMRNRAFTDIFEPGSTLKPFAIAAALDAGIVKPTTVVQTGSSLTIGSATIHDAHPHGPLTVEEVLQKSSNIGTARIALQLPAETMHGKLAAAGFGTPARTGFPGEVSGRLRPAKSWKPIEQATISYGHGISTNLVQLARAYTIFATDGELKPATLLKAAGPVPGQTRAQARDRARGAPHARARDPARRHRAQGADRRLSRRGQDGHRAQARGQDLREQVRVVVRRIRTGVEPAHRGGRDDRRALGRPVLRRHRGSARVLQRHGRRACACSACPRTRPPTT